VVAFIVYLFRMSELTVTVLNIVFILCILIVFSQQKDKEIKLKARSAEVHIEHEAQV